MARLLVRTAFANLRSRRLQTWLVALILAAASATLALAVSLRAGAADPYEKVARATNAADVHLLVHRGAQADLAALAHARGVRAADGPFRIVGVSIRSRPSNLNLTLEGVGAQPSIDRPKVTDGRWLSGAKGEVVLDRAFARDGRFRLGQRLTTVGPHGTTLTVVGFAIASGGDGSWVSPATLTGLGTRDDRFGSLLELQSPIGGRARRSSTTCAAATVPTRSRPGTGARTART